MFTLFGPGHEFMLNSEGAILRQRWMLVNQEASYGVGGSCDRTSHS